MTPDAAGMVALARAGAPLLAVARTVVENLGCRVFSVDDAGMLLGLLPRNDRALAETFLGRANDLAHSTQFATLSHGRMAGDIMRPPVALPPDDPLTAAFGKLLLGADLEGG